MSAHWHAGLDAGNGDIHIWPCGDLIEHDPDNCACGPQMVLEESPGGDSWTIRHNAADGREFEDPRDAEPEHMVVFTKYALAAVAALAGVVGFVAGRLTRRE